MFPHNGLSPSWESPGWVGVRAQPLSPLFILPASRWRTPARRGWGGHLGTMPSVLGCRLAKTLTTPPLSLANKRHCVSAAGAGQAGRFRAAVSRKRIMGSVGSWVALLQQGHQDSSTQSPGPVWKHLPFILHWTNT